MKQRGEIYSLDILTISSITHTIFNRITLLRIWQQLFAFWTNIISCSNSIIVAPAMVSIHLRACISWEAVKKDQQRDLVLFQPSLEDESTAAYSTCWYILEVQMLYYRTECLFHARFIQGIIYMKAWLRKLTLCLFWNIN